MCRSKPNSNRSSTLSSCLGFGHQLFGDVSASKIRVDKNVIQKPDFGERHRRKSRITLRKTDKLIVFNRNNDNALVAREAITQKLLRVRIRFLAVETAVLLD